MFSAFGSTGQQQQQQQPQQPGAGQQSAFGAPTAFGASAFGQSSFGQSAFGATTQGGGGFGGAGQLAAGQPSFAAAAASIRNSTAGGVFGSGTSAFGGGAGQQGGGFAAFSGTSGSVFGGQQQQQQQSAFGGGSGAPVAFGQSGGGSAFGGGGGTSSSVFGNRSAGGSVFGGGPSSTAQTSMFGQPQQQQPSGFGAFGQAGQQQQQSGGSVFGQPQQQAASVFGQPQQNTSSAFGQPQQSTAFGQPQQNTGSVFGQPQAQQNVGSVFGQATQQQPAVASVFGTSSGPSPFFTSPQRTQLQQQQQPQLTTASIFGQSSSQSSTNAPMFGSSSTSTAGLFGQPGGVNDEQKSLSWINHSKELHTRWLTAVRQTAESCGGPSSAILLKDLDVPMIQWPFSVYMGDGRQFFVDGLDVSPEELRLYYLLATNNEQSKAAASGSGPLNFKITGDCQTFVKRVEQWMSQRDKTWTDAIAAASQWLEPPEGPVARSIQAIFAKHLPGGSGAASATTPQRTEDQQSLSRPQTPLHPLQQLINTDSPPPSYSALATPNMALPRYTSSSTAPTVDATPTSARTASPAATTAAATISPAAPTLARTAAHTAPTPATIIVPPAPAAPTTTTTPAAAAGGSTSTASVFRFPSTGGSGKPTFSFVKPWEIDVKAILAEAKELGIDAGHPLLIEVTEADLARFRSMTFDDEIPLCPPPNDVKVIPGRV